MSVQAIAWVLSLGPEVAGADRLVLMSLANWCRQEADDDGTWESWPGIERIRREAGLRQPGTVKASLRRLEALGVISTVIQGAPDRRVRPDRRTNLYRLHSQWTPTPDGGTSGAPPCPDDGGTSHAPTGVRPTCERGYVSRANGGTSDVPLPVIDPLLDPGDNPSDAEASKPGRKRDLLWDAIVAVAGLEGKALTRGEASDVGVTRRELAAVDATPDEVRRRAAAWVRAYGADKFTHRVLRQRWAQMGELAERPAESRSRPVANVAPAESWDDGSWDAWTGQEGS